MLKSDMPKSDMPKSDMPKSDMPKSDMPKSNMPKSDMPKSDMQSKNLEEFKTVKDFLFLSDEELNKPETIKILASLDLKELQINAPLSFERLSFENREAVKEVFANRTKVAMEEKIAQEAQERLQKLKEQSVSLQIRTPEELKKEKEKVQKTSIEALRRRSGNDWRRRDAEYDKGSGKSWSDVCYPDEWKTDIDFPFEVLKSMAFEYLRQFKVKLTSKESEIIKKQIKAGTDYYLTGNQETMNKYLACILLSNHPKNWELRSTYDTVAYYLSNEEGIPPSCDVRTPILLVEYKDHLPENKLTEQLNLHLLTERQAKKLITIFLGRVPFPCVKDLCENIHCGKKVTIKGTKGGEVL
jgi:hypothetical protein